MKPLDSAINALVEILEVVEGERLLVVADGEKEGIADVFAEAGLKLGLWVRRIILEDTREYRREVPDFLREAIVNSRPNVALNLLRGVAEEVSFRISLIKMETGRAGARLGHCPGITMDMLTEGALALTKKEYKEMKEMAALLLSTLSGVKEVVVSNPEGTDFRLLVKDREFFTDVWLDEKLKPWLNLPVGEVIVAPLETKGEGVIVAEAAGGIGRVEWIKLEFSNGRVSLISSSEKEVEERVKKILKTDSQASLLGEFAIGLNKKARLVPEFLESEKIYGTIHVAFGNNSSFPGGRNRSRIHLDFLVIEPTVDIVYEDGNRLRILEHGDIVLPQ